MELFEQERSQRSVWAGISRRNRFERDDSFQRALNERKWDYEAETIRAAQPTGPGSFAMLDQAIERNNVRNAEVDEPVNAAFAAIKEKFDPLTPQVKAHIAEFGNTPRWPRKLLARRRKPATAVTR
jgi:hypothetical protein